MFGFSLYKLLVLTAVIVVVWYGFKFVGRLQDRHLADRMPRANPARRPKASGRGAEDPAVPEAEDMVACPVCRAYVQARGASSCGRPDCPY